MNDRSDPGHEVEDAGPLFPQDRTFVVRFDRTTDFGSGRCAGKLETVTTNSRHSFGDLGELLEKLRTLMG